jgi:hypothetical protein
MVGDGPNAELPEPNEGKEVWAGGAPNAEVLAGTGVGDGRKTGAGLTKENADSLPGRGVLQALEPAI